MSRWSGRRWQQLRAAMQQQVDAGARCSHCGEAILPGQAWDMDHLVPRADGGALLDPANLAPAHRACNRRAGQAMTTARRRPAHPQRPGFF